MLWHVPLLSVSFMSGLFLCFFSVIEICVSFYSINNQGMGGVDMSWDPVNMPFTVLSKYDTFTLENCNSQVGVGDSLDWGLGRINKGVSLMSTSPRLGNQLEKQSNRQPVRSRPQGWRSLWPQGPSSLGSQGQKSVAGQRANFSDLKSLLWYVPGGYYRNAKGVTPADEGLYGMR